jgi:hypothetical protein
VAFRVERLHAAALRGLMQNAARARQLHVGCRPGEAAAQLPPQLTDSASGTPAADDHAEQSFPEAVLERVPDQDTTAGVELGGAACQAMELGSEAMLQPNQFRAAGRAMSIPRSEPEDQFQASSSMSPMQSPGSASRHKAWDALRTSNCAAWQQAETASAHTAAGPDTGSTALEHQDSSRTVPEQATGLPSPGSGSGRAAWYGMVASMSAAQKEDERLPPHAAAPQPQSPAREHQALCDLLPKRAESPGSASRRITRDSRASRSAAWTAPANAGTAATRTGVPAEASGSILPEQARNPGGTSGHLARAEGRDTSSAAQLTPTHAATPRGGVRADDPGSILPERALSPGSTSGQRARDCSIGSVFAAWHEADATPAHPAAPKAAAAPLHEQALPSAVAEPRPEEAQSAGSTSGQQPWDGSTGSAFAAWHEATVLQWHWRARRAEPLIRRRKWR